MMQFTPSTRALTSNLFVFGNCSMNPHIRLCWLVGWSKVTIPCSYHSYNPTNIDFAPFFHEEIPNPVETSINYGIVISILTFCQVAEPALDLPDWWVPGLHDADLVLGAARYVNNKVDKTYKDLPM